VRRRGRPVLPVVGGAGTDQIQACAQQPKIQRGGVPYLSAGVTEAGLGNLKNYFATSLTYKQQGPLVVKMARDNGFLQGQWAVVATEGANFQDAVDGIKGALGQAGVKFKEIRPPKVPSNCSEFARQIKAEPRPTTIYFLGQPAFFAQCVQAIGSRPTSPPTPASVRRSASTASAPGVRRQRRPVQGRLPAPGHRPRPGRAPRAGVSFQDDIEYQIYGAMQGLESAFNQVPGNLTREKFIATWPPAPSPRGSRRERSTTAAAASAGPRRSRSRWTARPASTGRSASTPSDRRGATLPVPMLAAQEVPSC
jgi:hypothetical protein